MCAKEEFEILGFRFMKQDEKIFYLDKYDRGHFIIFDLSDKTIKTNIYWLNDDIRLRKTIEKQIRELE